MRRKIDFNNPAATIDNILFDVKLTDIYSKVSVKDKQDITKEIKIPNYRVLVNSTSGKVISIVSKDYKLIPNIEAIKLGKELFLQLFPGVDIDALIPFKVLAPKTLNSVHIDMIHKDVNFNVSEQEQWLPFMRISNSYNRTVALSYEIGFVRALCSNGVLFKKNTLRLKYYHTKDNRINVQNDASQIGGAINYFKDQCRKLSDIKFPREIMVPLVFDILHINLKIPDEGIDIQKWRRLNKLIKTTHELTNLYFGTIGDNAYAAFNVLSDLVSHEDVNSCLPAYHLHVRSYFTKPNSWAEQFIIKSNEKNFQINDYLKTTIKSLNDWKHDLYLHWELN